MTTSSPVRARWSRTLSASFVVGAMALLGAQGKPPVAHRLSPFGRSPSHAAVQSSTHAASPSGSHADSRTPIADRQAPAAPVSPRVEQLKREAEQNVAALAVLAQQMNDQVFSFGELAFQEVETSKYLTGVLEQNGFRIERNYAGIPDRVGRDVGLGQAGDRARLGHRLHPAGVPEARRGVPGSGGTGAPGHGEGHNSGVPLNIVAALAVKKIMEREHLPGTLKIWPGVAEEVVGAKAYFVRAGLFKDVDISLFTHVGNNLGTGWGAGPGTGLQSVEYTFRGEAAHAAVNPVARPLGARRRAS